MRSFARHGAKDNARSQECIDANRAACFNAARRLHLLICTKSYGCDFQSGRSQSKDVLSCKSIR